VVNVRIFKMTRVRPPLASLTAFALLMTAPVSHKPVTGIPLLAEVNALQIGHERIQLYGIGSPERQSCDDDKGARHACAEIATAELRRHVGSAPVMCVPVDRDRSQRLLAKCYLNKEDLSAWMVANGWAFARREFSGDYVRAEESARAQRLGIWGAEFMLPSHVASPLKKT